MRINYLLLVHTTKNIKRLISRLWDENSFFYVHVDSKKELGEFKRETIGFSNVKFVSERENVIWGDMSMVKATLALINQVKKDCSEDCYNILMSESDYPIKPKESIRKFFTNNYGKIFLSSRYVNEVWGRKNAKIRLNNYNIHPLPHVRKNISLNFYNLNILKSIKASYNLLKYKRTDTIYRALKKRRFPKYLKAYGGSQWWALPMEVLNYIDNFIENHPDYIEYHKFTHVPDEIFFHSIISSNFLQSTIEPTVTYVNWSRTNVSLPVTFSLSDLDELRNCGYLFARKFDQNISHELLDLIDKELLNTTIYKPH